MHTCRTPAGPSSVLSLRPPLPRLHCPLVLLLRYNHRLDFPTLNYMCSMGSVRCFVLVCCPFGLKFLCAFCYGVYVRAIIFYQLLARMLPLFLILRLI